ncbi:MAG: hypothetical protein VX617_04400 [Pseudomonadota bacterium]|nr:hypothetical protein [Pseudomonadota bacterium]
MRYSIQYQETTDGWAIFDTGGGTGLVCVCRTEEEALLRVMNLQEKSRISGYCKSDDSLLSA